VVSRILGVARTQVRRCLPLLDSSISGYCGRVLSGSLARACITAGQAAPIWRAVIPSPSDGLHCGPGTRTVPCSGSGVIPSFSGGLHCGDGWVLPRSGVAFGRPAVQRAPLRPHRVLVGILCVGEVVPPRSAAGFIAACSMSREKRREGADRPAVGRRAPLERLIRSHVLSSRTSAVQLHRFRPDRWRGVRRQGAAAWRSGLRFGPRRVACQPVPGIVVSGALGGEGRRRRNRGRLVHALGSWSRSLLSGSLKALVAQRVWVAWPRLVKSMRAV
jgi:hypothetical protein